MHKYFILLVFILASAILTAETKPKDSKRTELTNLLIEAKKEQIFGSAEKARQLYIQAIKIDSTCGACYYELSLLYESDGKFEPAYAGARAAYESDSANSWYGLQYARQSYRNKQYDKSERLFRRILRSHNDKQEVWRSLETSYEQQGRFKEALGILDSMDMRFGANDENVYKRYNIYMQLGEIDEALAEAKILAKNNADDPRFYTLLGDTYAYLGDETSAFDAYESALKINNTFTPAVLGKAEIYRKKGKFPEYFKTLQIYMADRDAEPKGKAEYMGLVLNIPSFAEHFKADMDTIFAITAHTHPTSLDLTYAQAVYFIRTERSETAVTLLNRMVQMDETDSKAWAALLSTEYNLKMWDELETSSLKAIKLFPTIPNFQMMMAMGLWRQKKNKEAIKVLETSVKHFKTDTVYLSEAYTTLGDLLQTTGKSKKIKQYYEKSLEFSPNNAATLNNYAYYLSIEGKELDKAYTMSKKSIGIEASNYIYLDTFAYILYKQGKYPEAKAIFRQAVSSGGNESAVILDHYADTLNKLGERDLAEIYWSQALDKPDCENAQEIKQKLSRK